MSEIARHYVCETTAAEPLKQVTSLSWGRPVPGCAKSSRMIVEHLSHGDCTVITFAFDATLDHGQVQEMARVVEAEMDQGHDLALLLDMRETRHFAPGAFLSGEGLWASLRSIGPVRRYAVVAAPALAATAVEAFGKVLPLESRAFDAAEIDMARQWVAATPD